MCDAPHSRGPLSSSPARWVRILPAGPTRGRTMSHIPVNHHLRPLYRTLAGFAAVYLLVFGVVGVAQTSGAGLFARDNVSALGLRTNLAFSVASVIAGGVILLAVFVGRNVDAALNLWGGIGFMAAG